MKAAYFDCFSGISGDMIIGALLDAGLDFDYLRNELKKLNLEDYEIDEKKIVKNNISATKFDIFLDKYNNKQNEERNINEINSIIEKSSLDGNIKTKLKKIFLKIAEAEAKVHNMPVYKVHFHEIGAIDTIIDVAGAVIGLENLGVEKVYCSKINLGSGFVEFSHGKFPVPAPATAEILRGIPVYSTDSNAELTTPTGAAIISVLADKFGEMPEIIVEKIGYGAGEKDLKQPNVLRVLIGKIEFPIYTS